MKILQDFSHNSTFIVCAFFTPNYEEHALGLQKSLNLFKLNYYIVEVADRGYWEANTRIKPEFLSDCLIQFPNKNILYIDADARVKNSLIFFETLTVDVCVYNTDRASGMSHQYLASTMFFSNRSIVKKLIDTWIRHQKKGILVVDQDSLDKAMNDFKDQLQILQLPMGYIKIFDQEYSDTIYIEQYQASRQFTKLRRRLIRLRNILLILILLAGIIILLH